MAYTIYNTDGSILLTLADGETDSVTTSLTLIGRNVTAYGQYFNNNLIKLMASFSSPNEPINPIVGQLWYDTSTGRVKVYDANQVFSPVTGILPGTSKPIDLVSNDLWYDTFNKQLFYQELGLDQPTLIAPTDSALYGNTGLKTETVVGTDNNFYNISKLYTAGNLIGILSTTSFTLAVSTAGMTTVGIGLNLNTHIPGIRFIGTATSADAIQGISVGNFLRSDINTTTYGSFTIDNAAGLNIINSSLDNINIYTDPGTHEATIQYGTPDAPLRIQVTSSSSGLVNVLYATPKNLGVWNTNPQYPLDIVGDTRITGNLLVAGTVTSIISYNLEVNEPTITLGYGQLSPSDSFVNGGGVIVTGTTAHTLLWMNDGTGWNSNDNFNLTSSTSVYNINGEVVLSLTSLGSSVTTAPGLVSLGTLSVLTVTNITISGNSVSSKHDLSLNPATSIINANNSTIINVADPVNGTDAANKEFVLNTFQLSHANALSMTIDVTRFSTLFPSVNAGVKNYLDLMFPVINTGTDMVFNLPNGSRAKVLCGTTSVPATTTTVVINYSTQLVDQGGVQNSALVVDGRAGAVAAYTDPNTFIPVTTYVVQTWKVESGVWTFIN